MEHLHNTEVREIKIVDDITDDSNLIKIKEYPESEVGTGCIVWECVDLINHNYQGANFGQMGS